jgi:hypothetical protein
MKFFAGEWGKASGGKTIPVSLIEQPVADYNCRILRARRTIGSMCDRHGWNTGDGDGGERQADQLQSQMQASIHD